MDYYFKAYDFLKFFFTLKKFFKYNSLILINFFSY